MKCQLCGEEHAPEQECGSGKVSLLKTVPLEISSALPVSPIDLVSTQGQDDEFEPNLQRYQSPVFQAFTSEEPEIDLPQFEAPRFDLPQTGPLDSDAEYNHLPRYKPPIFDLLRSNIPNSENSPDESNP